MFIDNKSTYFSPWCLARSEYFAPTELGHLMGIEGYKRFAALRLPETGAVQLSID
jgi:hypothetical protein